MPRFRRFRFSMLSIFIVSSLASAQLESARAEIDSIAGHAHGRIGAAVVDLSKGDTLSFRGDEHFPMQSVYKFPLALAVLHRVDQGALSLDQRIHITKKDLLPNTWSPLREKYPNGDVDVTLDEVLSLTVSQSDNNGCDILFRLMGGTDSVNQYIHGLGITEIAIVATEEEMHTEWSVQYRNWATPHALAQMLSMFDRGGILSERSRAYLWDVMASTTTGVHRLKGRLPQRTIVAHKTGSSGTNELGIAAATNDVGIITLPDGSHLIVVVFVSDSKDGESERDSVIANIARAAWDALSRR